MEISDITKFILLTPEFLEEKSIEELIILNSKLPDIKEETGHEVHAEALEDKIVKGELEDDVTDDDTDEEYYPSILDYTNILDINKINIFQEDLYM